VHQHKTWFAQPEVVRTDVIFMHAEKTAFDPDARPTAQ
jgi:hypothetical protein